LQPNIGLNAETRKTVADALNKILAAEHVLYVKTRNYHWNVTGPHFFSLHQLFEQQYEALEESIDEIAERVRALGFHAVGTMAEFLKLSDLKEEEADTYPSAEQMVTRLVEGHEASIRSLREAIAWIGDDCNDQGTADFLTGLMEAHEKTAWMLRSVVTEK